MKPLDPRLLPHLTPARVPLAGVVSASTLSGLLLIAQAFAVASLVTSLLSDGAGAGEDTVAAGIAVALTTLARACTGWAVDVLAARASGVVTTTLRRRLLDAGMALGPYALSRRRSGELALLATRGVTAVDPYLTRYLPALVVAGVLPALTVVAIATQDLLSAAIVLGTLPLVPVFAILVGLATRDRADRQWRTLSSLSGHFLDVMRGLPTLVAYRRASAQSASIRSITDRYRRATNETLRVAFASSAVLELVATISVALVAVVVGLRLAHGSLDLGTALVVLLLAPEAYWPLRRVGAEFHAAAEGTATFEAADELLRAGAEGTAGTAAVTGQGACERRPADGVRLEGLTAGYPGRPEPVLSGLTANLPSRGVTAVVGPSGSGKSTLLAVLMGHLPLSRGRVLLGGEPVDLSSDSWRSRISWVPQRPWIGAGTVAENVRIASPDASDDAVWEALEAVSLRDVVAALPDGLDHVLGEDGGGLSAGERARLSLARAVIAGRPFVLLDEPTAHLDAVTEAVIVQTVLRLAQRSCVVVVAHRAALVEIADQVVEVPVLSSALGSNARPTLPGTTSVPRPTSPAEGATAAAAVESETWWTRPRALLFWAAVLGALSAAAGVALTATAGWLIARAAEQPPVLLLMVAIVGVRTFGLARPALRYAERLVSHDVALRLLAERRAQVYDALVPLVPGRLGRDRGDVLASVVDDVDSLVDRYLRVRAPLLTYAVVGTLATAFATWLVPAAGLVIAVVLLGGGALGYGVSHQGVARTEAEYVDGRALLSARVVHTLQGMSDLLMWQAHHRALAAVDQVGTDVVRAAGASARAVATGRALALAACGAGVLGVAWVGRPVLAAGDVSGPMLALLLLLPIALLEVVSPLADVGALQVRVRAADARLAALRERAPAVTDPAAPLTLPPVAGGVHVALAHATAGWDGSPAFRDLGLELPPGSRTGIVGPSGCGKSTLAAVLLRFLDPVEGRFLVAGMDARSLRLADVRRTVGLVDDDPHIFASSLYENVRLARPDASPREVEAALAAVHLGDWVSGLPQGLGTLLGEGHAHVSGGERARIGMARAVLADLPVLVLDEPTAHLDSSTAEAVAADLLGASSARTVVWITHSTVGLDRVDSVLDMGNLCSGGSASAGLGAGAGSAAGIEPPQRTGAMAVPRRG